MELTGFSRSAIYQNIKIGLFPPPVHAGAQTSVWAVHEICAVNAARLASKPNEEIRELVKRLVADRAEAAETA
jgi:prophage regulatory protein